ncbi:MAG: trypsin-like peptidase domain-containing protein [Pseudomonadota bacterium]
MHRLSAYLRPAAVLAVVVTVLTGPAHADQNRTLLAPEQTLISLFEHSKDSVVAITTEARVLDPWRRQAQMVPQGSGSGFFWDDQGHVVTNAHVIEGANAAEVHLSNGRVFPAQLVGAAPRHDLAVLRIAIDADAPGPLPVGRSETLRVGQSVLAIGNPFGLDWTLTTGIVSAMGREIPNGQGGRIEGLIQTDAAINPGNSGGPLIDSAGQLIGVNTAIFSPSGSSAGIGFAVPVDTVARVVPQLIATGAYRPPVLGVTFDPRVDALARQQGVTGVVILDVAPGSPAAGARLQRAARAPGGTMRMGDVIVGLGGRQIASSVDLQSALDAYAPGDRVALKVWNNGDLREVEVTLAAPD